jgi:hypothetical protein
MGGRDMTIGEWIALTHKRVGVTSWSFDPDA